MRVTTDHTQIRKWIEKNGGEPAIIGDQNLSVDTLGIRVDYPGGADEELLSFAKSSSDTTWDKFFQIFEHKKYAFMYESENTKSTKDSYRFIPRDQVESR